MKSVKSYFMALFVMISGSWGCLQSPKNISLKNGDLLFRETISNNLSHAIDQVTQTDSATHFSHIGLVEFIDENPTALHASPIGGTCRISLNDFVNPEGDSVQVVIYRLKHEWQHTIPSAITKAKSMLGKPYNFSYILSDTKHYCSEYIYRAFETDSVFELNPMTFKDPKSGEFPMIWVDYYKKLDLEIPEGLPGCNPNGMAASKKIECIGKL